MSGDILKTGSGLGSVEGAPHETPAVGFEAVLAELGLKLAQVHVYIGNLLYQETRIAEAEAAYRQALARDPKHDFAPFGLGESLLVQAKYDEAAVWLRATLDDLARQVRAAFVRHIGEIAS